MNQPVGWTLPLPSLSSKYYMSELDIDNTSCITITLRMHAHRCTHKHIHIHTTIHYTHTYTTHAHTHYIMHTRLYSTTLPSCTGFFSSCVCSLSRHGRVVIMSIHQPRYSILKLFDTITLLSRGEMIYHGASRAALPYFSSVLGMYMHKYTLATLYIFITFLFYAYACYWSSL